MSQRKRFRVAYLVASTDKLTNIKAKRLNIQVKYTTGFTNNIFETNILGINSRQF
jgi:hypothetical protein